MGASIVLPRRRGFNGLYGKIIRGKTVMFSVQKTVDDKFNLIPENKALPAVKGLSQAQLNDKVGRMNRVHLEINEGDIVLG